MEGYISKQSAIEALEKERGHLLKNNMLGAENILVHHALRIIDEIPPADVVSVVRCKDCKEFYFAGNRIRVQQGWTCGRYNLPRRPDDFCSRGERRGEDG